MKQILIATIVVGAAVAGVLLYLREQTSTRNSISDTLNDASDDAHKLMHNHVGRTERMFDHALN